MKSLLILRHSKSSWKDPNLKDHNRPLNKRGKRDAPRMGEELRQENILPDLIISSTAKRARKTAKLVAASSGYQGEIRTTRQLYFTEPVTWYKLLQDVSNRNFRVMVVGHNPGLEEFLRMLTGEVVVMPTSALAEVSFAIENWQEFDLGVRGELLKIRRPRELT